jgi:hypothetical protein
LMLLAMGKGVEAPAEVVPGRGGACSNLGR